MHRYLETVADNIVVYYSKPGNGICHQVHLERYCKPGKTLIGCDSHTVTCGAAGMVAFGVGGLEVALAMAGQPLYLVYPKIVRVWLTGKLSPWANAKDAILELLKSIRCNGNVGICWPWPSKPNYSPTGYHGEHGSRIRNYHFCFSKR